MILNLLTNAAQAIITRLDTAEPFDPQITIRSLTHDDVVQIVIEDNGIGIEEQAMERIFEPFYTTKEVGEGTGLGLWLSWAIIVERHNGRIWVDTLPEGGIVFTIELPYK